MRTSRRLKFLASPDSPFACPSGRFDLITLRFLSRMPSVDVRPKRAGWTVGLQDLERPLLVHSHAQGLSLRIRGALMDVRRRRPIDQQAEQFGAAVVAARVH